MCGESTNGLDHVASGATEGPSAERLLARRGVRRMGALAEPAHAPLVEVDAFRKFYEQALPRIYGYFYHRCGRAAGTAEDLTQETFLAAVTELRKGRRVDD